jgi:hypothetical protein
LVQSIWLVGLGWLDSIYQHRRFSHWNPANTDLQDWCSPIVVGVHTLMVMMVALAMHDGHAGAEEMAKIDSKIMMTLDVTSNIWMSSGDDCCCFTRSFSLWWAILPLYIYIYIFFFFLVHEGILYS